jgi:hypothetical protein
MVMPDEEAKDAVAHSKKPLALFIKSIKFGCHGYSKQTGGRSGA